MLQLPHGCYCSQPNVHPSLWQTPKASLKKDWYIFYRFYDPTYMPTNKKGKLIIIKGMNHFKTLAERQAETQRLLDVTTVQLMEKGYNPITRHSLPLQPTQATIHPQMPFLEALYTAESRIQASYSTKRDLRSTLRFISRAAMQLNYAETPLQKIGRKHLKLLLSHIDLTLGESSHRYNKVRTYLMMLYNELIELEAAEYNPLLLIKKRQRLVRLRTLLTPESRKEIDSYLKQHQYPFWLFTHIFFHSGARLTELMSLKRRHVDLHKQRFIVIIKKGRQYKEVYKPIKDIALPYWQEAVQAANPDDYVFSKALLPGKERMNSSAVTKRWKRHIKGKLGITEDFYSLKHLNLDETAALIDIHHAAALASHTSTAITVKHYALNEGERQQEKIRKLQNRFA